MVGEPIELDVPTHKLEVYAPGEWEPCCWVFFLDDGVRSESYEVYARRGDWAPKDIAADPDTYMYLKTPVDENWLVQNWTTQVQPKVLELVLEFNRTHSVPDCPQSPSSPDDD